MIAALALVAAFVHAQAEPPATDEVVVEDDAPATVEPVASPTTAPSPTPPATGPTETAEVGVVERPEKDPTVFPDPKKFSRGFFVEAGIGPGIPIGPTAEVLSVGVSLGLRTGYEIRRWVALQLHASGTLSRYDDGVLRRELLQQFVYTGELRFAVPIRRFLIAAQGGAGMYQLTNNLLQVAGIAEDNRRIGVAWDASLAFDVHSLNRHISGGLVATFVGMPALDNAGMLVLHVVLRYTP